MAAAALFLASRWGRVALVLFSEAVAIGD